MSVHDAILHSVIIANSCGMREFQTSKPCLFSKLNVLCFFVTFRNLTCDAARALRSFDNMEPLLSTHELRKRKVANGIREDIKPCPRCQVLIVKMDDGSCNHMACLCCGAEFCWLCMKQVSDLHYLRYIY